MRMIRSIGLCASALVFATTTVIGQQSETEQPVSEQPVSEQPASEQPASEQPASKQVSPETASPKPTVANETTVSNNVVSWEPIDTHLQVTVSVTGKDFTWRQTFDDHQFPKFDPSEHEDLEPGLYKYSLSYISNDIVDQKSELESLKSERKNLLQQYEKAIEAGDAEAVKRLYWQANEVRTKASAISREQMQMQSQQRKKADSDAYIHKKGRIVIDENGVVSKYDSAEAQEERSKKSQQKRRPDTPAPTTEDELGE